MRFLHVFVLAVLLMIGGSAWSQQQQQQRGQQPMVIEATPRPSLLNRIFRGHQNQAQNGAPQMAPAQQTTVGRSGANTAEATPSPRRSSNARRQSANAAPKDDNKKADEPKKDETPKADDADVKADEAPKADPKKADEPKKDEVAPKTAQKEKLTAAERKAADDLAKEKARLEELVGKAKQAATLFIHVANKGLYSRAQQMLVPAQQEFYLGAESVTRGVSFKELLDKMTQDGTVKRMLITCNVRGEGCRVFADLTYKTGQTLRVVFDMMLISDNWRVMIISPEKNTIATTSVPTPVIPEETPATAEATPAAGGEAAAAPTEKAEQTTETPTTAAEAAPATDKGTTSGSGVASAADVIASLANDSSASSAPVSSNSGDAPWRR